MPGTQKDGQKQPDEHTAAPKPAQKSEALHPSSEEIRERGGLHAFDAETQQANADRPDGHMRDTARAERARGIEPREQVGDVGDTSGIELGGHRSMRPDTQSGTDQGAVRGFWRGEGWNQLGHHEAADQGRPDLANQVGPTPVSSDGGETQNRNADRGKPGDSRHKAREGEPKPRFGT